MLGTSASDVTHWEAGRKRDVVTKWAQEGRAQLLAWGWPRQDMDGAALSLHLWEAQRAAQFWERFDALLQPRDGTVLQRRHIAQALGVAQQTVADWMNGRNRPMPGAPVEAATTATTADGEERTHETPPPPRPAAAGGPAVNQALRLLAIQMMLASGTGSEQQQQQQQQQ